MHMNEGVARCRIGTLLILLTALGIAQAAERPPWADRVDHKVQEVKAEKGIPGLSLA